MKKNLYLIFGIMFLISLNFVSSVPPVTTVQEFPEGYTIVENPHLYLVQNQDYQYNFFVYNSSTGILLDNSSLTCNFFLANKTGEIIFNGNPKYFSDGHWGIDILGGNFSYTGTHPYGLSCQDGFGGALAGDFEIIEDTENNAKDLKIDLSNNINLILFIISLLIAFGLLLFRQNSWSGFIFMILGLILIFSGYNYLFGGMIFLLGIFIIFKE